ncbi:MAG: TlpA family protein disulfide reductase [Spirochaetaceae bacterium]
MKKIIILLTTLLIISCDKDIKKEEIQSEVKTETISENSDDFLLAGINRVDPKVEAPNFTLENLEGEKVSLSDYKGKVIFLNFWAYWCGPCKEEMPSINNLYKLTKDENIIVLTVNLGESNEIVSNYLKSNNFQFEALLDSDQKIGALYGIRSIPTTYIIDKDGMVVGGKLGSHSWDSQNVIDVLKGLQ